MTQTAPTLGAPPSVDLQGMLARARGVVDDLQRGGEALTAQLAALQPAVVGGIEQLTNPAAAEHLPTATADMARARSDADATLARIDWSRPDISIWVPGTGRSGVQPEWQAAVDANHPAGMVSSVALDYPASDDFSGSVATGKQTLRYVLQGIAEHGGQHDVTLAGHSQGAWVAGDVMADPVASAGVSRAVLYGHPAEADTQYRDGHDPRVREVDSSNDPYSQPLHDRDDMLATMQLLHTGNVGSAIARAGMFIARDPSYAAAVAGYLLRPAGSPNPHAYEASYGSGAAFLATGA